MFSAPLAGRSMQGDVKVRLDWNPLPCTDEARWTAPFRGFWNILQAVTLALGPLLPLR